MKLCNMWNPKLFALLAFVLILSLFVGMGEADVYKYDCQVEGQWQYCVMDTQEVIIVGYLDPDFAGTLEVPETLGGLPVTTVYGLKYMNNLTKVVLPDSVVQIKAHAFYDDKQLSEVILSQNLQHIGSSAFLGCEHLESITLPDSLERIDSEAFYFCGLKSVYIPANISFIGKDAFRHSKLEFVEFGAGRQISLENNVFSDTLITEFSVSQDHANLAAYQGVLFDKVEKRLLSYPSGRSDVQYSIPTGIKSIGKSAFANTNLHMAILPDTVTQIEDYAFYYSNIMRIDIPSSVQSIGNLAFAECSDLALLELNDGLISIGSDAFTDCADLSSIFIPKSVQQIGDSAFAGCISLNQIYVDAENPYYYIENSALIERHTCKLLRLSTDISEADYIIPEGIKIIGQNSFAGCNLNQIIFPTSVVAVEDYAFAGLLSATDIVMNEGLLLIGEDILYQYDYYGPKVNIVIPSSVGRIAEDAFYTDYTELTIYQGTYGEKYCIDNDIPCTVADTSPANSGIALPAILPGLSGYDPDELNKLLSNTSLEAANADDMSDFYQSNTFPGNINCDELLTMQKAFFSPDSRIRDNLNSATDLWYITAMYSEDEYVESLLGTPYISSDFQFVSFFGTLQDAFQLIRPDNLYAVCLSRRGVLYTFYDDMETTYSISLSLSVQGNQLLGIAESFPTYTIESTDSPSLTWEINTDESFYKVKCTYSSSSNTSSPHVYTGQYSYEGLLLSTSDEMY